MGVRPLDPAGWILPDADLADQLRQKWHLFETVPDTVFRAEPETLAAQAELLALLVGHLVRHFPDIYEATSETVTIKPLDATVSMAAFDCAPLALAGQLVQEDLLLLAPGPDGHRLVAGALCFPSSWSLAEKIGKPLLHVHDPVPGYADRLSERVERLFARLPPGQCLWRMNWSLDDGERLHRPESPETRDWDQPGRSLLDLVTIRVERQTLRRLERSGCIVFTVRIYLDRLSDLAKYPDCKRLAKRLRDQLARLSPEEASYKGIESIRPALLLLLDDLAGY